VTEAFDLSAELLEAQLIRLRGEGDRVDDAAQDVGCRGRLEHARLPVIGRDPQVGERASDIRSYEKAQRFPPAAQFAALPNSSFFRARATQVFARIGNALGLQIEQLYKSPVNGL
jgi:hypothetical protein